LVIGHRKNIDRKSLYINIKALQFKQLSIVINRNPYGAFTIPNYKFVVD